jgi:hypothetical protein
MCLDVHFLVEKRGSVKKGVDKYFLFLLFWSSFPFLLLKGDGVWRVSERTQVLALLEFLEGSSGVRLLDDCDQFSPQCSLASCDALPS